MPQRLYDAHVQAPSGAPSWLEAFMAAERPDLWSLARDDRLFDGLWPEYNHHGNHTGRYFGSLPPRLPGQRHERTGVAAVARRHDLAPLVAPVRPSWKDRHPLTPVERYAR